MGARRRGEGAVYRRGRIFWVKYYVRGRAFRESSGSATERNAVVLLRRRLSEIAAGSHAPNAERLRVSDLVRFVEDDYRLNRRRSLSRVRQSFQHICHYFEQTRVVDITADRIACYVRARMDAGTAAATIANELAALKRGFSLAIRLGRLNWRPAFPTIQLANARAGFFEEEDFRALLPELPEYLHAPITFAYVTGWRITSEILTLRWTQVDFDAGIIRLEPGTTKNGDAREWPLNALPQLRELLERQLACTRRIEHASRSIVPFVFHRSGARIRSFRTAWNGACARTGLRGRIPHDFRRTAVRSLERAGVSRSVAMKLVGHKTESVYRRYAIVSPRDLADGVAKLATLRGASQCSTLSPSVQHP